MFPSDEQFGQWVTANLADTHDHDRAAAMRAVGNPLLLAIRGVRPDQSDEHEHQCGYDCYVSHDPCTHVHLGRNHSRSNPETVQWLA
jgi:hypothetical protein